MKRKNSELNSELRNSFDKYSLLDAKDYDKLSGALKKSMITLNKSVETYLNAGISWTQIKKLLMGQTKLEFNMNFDNSLRVVNNFGKKMLDSWLLPSDLMGIGPDGSIFKELSPADVLKIAQLRSEISHTTDDKERELKIQKIFKIAAQINKDRAFSRGKFDFKNDLLRKTYAHIWSDGGNCMAAFSSLEKMEKDKNNEQKQQNSPYFLAAKRVKECEDVIMCVAYHVNCEKFREIQRVKDAIKVAEVCKDQEERESNFATGNQVPKGYRLASPTSRSEAIKDWDHLLRNTLSRKVGRG